MRLIVLTSSRVGTASDCLPALAASSACEIAAVVLAGGRLANRRRHVVRKLRKILRIGLLGALNGVRMRKWYDSGPSDELIELCDQLSIKLIMVDNINSAETEAVFREAKADLGLSLGNPYISRKIFSIPKYGMVNVHGELLPDYQNAQSVIWPIYFGKTSTGVTVHKIDQGIDTGEILHREEFPIDFAPHLRDTVSGTIQNTRARTPSAIVHVVENFARLSSSARAQPKGKVLTTPSIRQYLQMRKNNRVLYQEHALKKSRP